ncbi:hypothetical protein PBAC_02170 [Pedobacter glucosidilyticus]|nr:T9SS C-terminal target domain-containing protein [Pedobacter glucosidilyticus]KHJ39706.1 hypothetical protein PBAC_02170 [Pedobacter glucosidilyticus]
MFKRRLLFFFFLFFLIAVSSASKAQNISNEGTSFWLCFPAHVPSGGSLANISVFVTSKSNSSGKVQCGTFSKDFSVAANTITEVVLPRDISYIGEGTSVFSNKGIKVTVDLGKPKIVVYGHIFAGARSAATLVLPNEALGQKYHAMAYTQSTIDRGLSQLNVVAVEANTTVNITPVLDGIKQSTFQVVLPNIGDVYQYQNPQDVTGTLIEVDKTISNCKKIAVFSGSSAIIISSPFCIVTNDISLDPLLQQLYPIESWGVNFSMVPFYDRDSGSIYRILASENNTNVNLLGATITLNAGEYYTTAPVTSFSFITADKKISVAQYALTQICADSRNGIRSPARTSDPDMVLLNPLEYSIDRITLYSSTKLNIAEQFLNITIPTSKVSSFKLNNQDFSNRFTAFPSKPEFSYAQILLHQIGGSSFSLSADTGFNAIAYGFGNYESYAYSAGTSLASNINVSALKSGTNQAVKIACVSDTYDFKLALPYRTTKLVWKLEASDTEIVQNNPEPIIINSGNKVLYEYRLSSQKNFSSSGVKKIIITSTTPPGANICSTTDEEVIEFDFEVIDLPVPEFTFPAATCLGTPANFTYVEKNIGEPVNSWTWDFGDGSTSTLQNPSHIYARPGNYKVKLVLKSIIGCLSNVLEKTVFIAAPQVSKIGVASPLCVNTNISFRDESTSQDGNIIAWEWDFGDNTTISTLQNPSHLFAVARTYNVKLTTTTSFNCKNTITRSFVINNPAEITFDDPGSCVNDFVGFKAKVLTGSVTSWFWNFGDGTNDVSQNTKAEPVHKYNAAGQYTVTLTAISTEGCNAVFSRVIKISGANPQPIFEVMDATGLCSNKEVFFKNKSTIPFGNITKIEWFFQYNGVSSVPDLVDVNPQFDEIYSFKYPKNHLATNYRVVLRAYSGSVCFQQSLPTTVTVNGSPSLSFLAPAELCLNNFRVLLNGKDINSIAGTGKYVGKGVVDGVYFDPVVAGVGNHEIVYSFLTPRGCADTVKQTIRVLDVPEVDAGEDLNILLAGEKQIQAKIIKGENLTYKWSPSIGLSDDKILNPIASPKETTKYILTVSSPQGCYVADEVLVAVYQDPNIPNAFSPNGDGYNDTWVIKYLESFVSASIKIFNRYGQVVFEAQQYNTHWNGRFNGVDVPVGVYYYIIEPNNGRNRYTGSITLIR